MASDEETHIIEGVDEDVIRPTSFLDNHRGPFRFHVTRPHPNKVKRDKGFFTSEWVKGEVAKEDTESEARALLADIRDTIIGVHVWSVREEQFVGGYK